MTPTQQIGGMPQLPPEKPDRMQQGNPLPDPVARKVLEATTVATAVRVIPNSQTPKFNSETLLKIPPAIKHLILANLTSNDLSSLEIALGKGTVLEDNSQPAFHVLKQQISKAKQNLILQEILVDHPSWQPHVASWKGISLDDKIWLLQLYELRNLGVDIPQIAHEGIPSPSTPDLLQPDTKTAIDAALSEITSLEIQNRKIQKCPQSISLLGNLEVLILNSNKLSTPPDVSKNLNLLFLSIFENPLRTPPDVSKNVKLLTLNLIYTELSTAPDISKNVNLQYFRLDLSRLKIPPNVSNNIHLKSLSLQRNNLKIPPDVTRNAHLQELYLGHNKLTSPPNVSRNVKLQTLSMTHNRLSNPPDVSKNVDLNEIDLGSNRLKVPPVITRNIHLQILFIDTFHFNKKALEALKKLKKERKNLRIALTNNFRFIPVSS